MIAALGLVAMLSSPVAAFLYIARNCRGVR